jgi:hypothetical protein
MFYIQTVDKMASLATLVQQPMEAVIEYLLGSLRQLYQTNDQWKKWQNYYLRKMLADEKSEFLASCLLMVTNGTSILDDNLGQWYIHAWQDDGPVPLVAELVEKYTVLDQMDVTHTAALQEPPGLPDHVHGAIIAFQEFVDSPQTSSVCITARQLYGNGESFVQHANTFRHLAYCAECNPELPSPARIVHLQGLLNTETITLNEVQQLLVTNPSHPRLQQMVSQQMAVVDRLKAQLKATGDSLANAGYNPNQQQAGVYMHQQQQHQQQQAVHQVDNAVQTRIRHLEEELARMRAAAAGQPSGELVYQPQAVVPMDEEEPSGHTHNLRSANLSSTSSSKKKRVKHDDPV